MGKIIVVCNQKGGIGKTTTAICLATGLAKLGYKTLLGDMDPQMNASDTYHAASNNVATMYDLLVEGDTEDVIQHTDLGDIIACDKELKNADKQITGPSAFFRLKEGLEKFRDQYDYIILDTPPALNILSANALTAADTCVIPLLADRYSLQGLTALKKDIADVQKYTNPNLKVEGLLLVKFGGKMNTEKAVLAELDAYAERLGSKVFNTRIRNTNTVVKAQMSRTSLFEFDPSCTAAIDYMDLVKEVSDNG